MTALRITRPSGGFTVPVQAREARVIACSESARSDTSEVEVLTNGVLTATFVAGREVYAAVIA